MGCTYGLSAFFADLTEKQYKHIRKKSRDKRKENYILFNGRVARAIVDFIKKVNKTKAITLVVHCHAGISRSGAVGIFAMRYLGIEEKLFRDIHERYIDPNPYVYDLLCLVSGLKEKYERFWKKKKKGQSERYMEIIISLLLLCPYY